MRSIRYTILKQAIGAAVASMAGIAGSVAIAQEKPPVEGQESAASGQSAAGRDNITSLNEVSVVGTQIRGSTMVTSLLPLSTVTSEQIEATGSVSGGDLFRFVPQMGEVTFANGGATGGANSSNHARGDVAGINLRSLGVGSTLLLINGRRTVVHPMSQSDDQLVPVLSYNASTLPVPALSRLDVLLDGAAAIYGTDAVAGVVNAVLKDDVDGGEVSVQYGAGEGTDLRDFTLNGLVGKNYHDYRGNTTLSFTYMESSGLDSWDQEWTRTYDRRGDFVGTEFAGAAALDQRPVYSRWGNFTALGTGTVTQNGSNITNAAGVFHVKPDTYANCTAHFGDGLCLGAGNKLVSGSDRNLRADPPKDYPVDLNPPEFRRINLFLTSKYDFDNGIGFFSEAGYYNSYSTPIRQAVYSLSSRVTVPESNYWNPFGPTTFANGAVNPNRLPGLSISEDGAPVRIDNYRVDVPTYVEVEAEQVRALAGLRGQHFGFDWESALLYTYAQAEDCFNGVSMTLLQRSLALSTPDAYNVFGGSNSQATVDSVSVDSCRRAKTSLALWDFKASRPDLFSTWAGDVGFAFGTELRHEKHDDDRDQRVDGTIQFTDSVTGVTDPTDLYGDSPTPDTYGSRTVRGLFAELQVPLVSAEMKVPLVRSLDMQIAVRTEHYSDFGTVTKPKYALGWEIFDGFRVRASYSEGFRAPNIEQLNASMLARANTHTDYVMCEADQRNGTIGSFSNCSHRGAITGRRFGNPDLQPETSETWTAGIAFAPRFVPESWGKLSLTADYFEYDQDGLIGVFGEGNGVILDYALRMQGSSNPNVVRADPTEDDIARFAGTGIAPVGEVLYVNDGYVNLQPQRVRGVDFSVAWDSPETRAGRFHLMLNGTKLIEFYREPSADIQQILDARDAGIISQETIITGGGDLVGIDGKPEWKWSGSLLWNLGKVSAGASVRYVGTLYDDTVVNSRGEYWEVASHSVTNVFARYDFENDGWLNGTSVKFGINNLNGKRPPVAATMAGYMATVYQPLPRYFYINIAKKF